MKQIIKNKKRKTHNIMHKHKYGYEYVYSSNELRLEWSADWDSMYPWAPRCVGPM